MSRPTTPPKQNWMQSVLIMVMVFCGWNLFTSFRNPPQNVNPTGPKLVTRADYLTQITLDDQLGKEATAQRQAMGATWLNGQTDYFGLIDKDVKRGIITKNEGEREKIEAATHVANAFMKGGILTNNSNGIRTAYQVLQPFFRHDQRDVAWTTPVTVYQTPTKTVSVTPDQLRQQIIETLSFRNKSDKVWGVIPGGYQMIDFLVHLTGARPYFSYAFAAFLLALALRTAVFPLSQKQLMFSRQMSQLTPRISEIKKQYPNDQAEQSKRTMELYKEYGINPAAGCLPAFVQMPLFLTIYQCMLHYQFQFSHGYFLWINPSMSAAHDWIAHDLGQQDYILIVIYGITMTISTLLTPVTDPTQAKQQRGIGLIMSLAITFFMFTGAVPVVSGFVLYWTFTNILATAQSFRAYRLPLPPLVKVNAPGGGVFPSAKPQGLWMKMLEDAQRMAEEKGKNEKAPDPINPPSNGKANKNGQADLNLNGNSNGKASEKNDKSKLQDSNPGKKAKYRPKKRQ